MGCGMADQYVAKSIQVRWDGGTQSSLWIWQAADADVLTVAFLNGRHQPVVWRVRRSVLDGGRCPPGMTITFDGSDAVIALDGVGDRGEDVLVEGRAPAERLRELAVDIGVVLSAETFDKALRGLIDG